MLRKVGWICFLPPKSLHQEIPNLDQRIYWLDILAVQGTLKNLLSSVQFSPSVVSESLQPHGLQHTKLPCPSPTPRIAQTNIHRVSDAIQPFHPLSSPSPPAFNLFQHQGLFQCKICCILHNFISYTSSSSSCSFLNRGSLLSKS